MTKYYYSEPDPEEEFLLYDPAAQLIREGVSARDVGSMVSEGEIEGEIPRLRQLGYSESEQYLVYTCAILEEDHILPWEIYSIYDMLKKKQIGDYPLQSVRVLFPNRREAEKEKRPLLDIGAQVIYLDEIGVQQELIR